MNHDTITDGTRVVLLRAAQDSGQLVQLLVQGQWFGGLVAHVDEHDVVVVRGTDKLVLSLDHVAGVQVTERADADVPLLVPGQRDRSA